jgi:hypothetical protein
MKSFEEELREARTRIAELEARANCQPQLDRIADALETLNARLDAALGPGSGGRSSVTILDQLCALSDDTSAIANRLEP